ncbi:MAG: hypothetical protein Q8L21_01485 [Candidatus Komeilibacteria bacterium]|nr:hypothetical protein [Candidatus Komeilibacteria bacterium]
MVIQQYQDPRVKRYLSYGYWYQEHHWLINKIAHRTLWAVVAIIWLICFYNVYNFIRSQVAFNQVLAELTRERAPVLDLHQTRAPAEPVFGSVAVIPGSTAEQADFAAYAENTNQNWYIDLEFIITWADGQTVTQTALLLPQTKTILMARGITVNSLPVMADLAITAKKWHRIVAAAERERIIAFQNSIIIDNSAVSNDGSGTQARYTIKNQSIYDWLTPRFAVVLLQGQTPTAIGINEIPELAAASETVAEYRWLQPLPSNVTAVVYPLINPLQTDSYRLPSGNNYAL